MLFRSGFMLLFLFTRKQRKKEDNRINGGNSNNSTTSSNRLTLQLVCLPDFSLRTSSVQLSVYAPKTKWIAQSHCFRCWGALGRFDCAIILSEKLLQKYLEMFRIANRNDQIAHSEVMLNRSSQLHREPQAFNRSPFNPIKHHSGFPSVSASRPVEGNIIIWEWN